MRTSAGHWMRPGAGAGWCCTSVDGMHEVCVRVDEDRHDIHVLSPTVAARSSHATRPQGGYEWRDWAWEACRWVLTAGREGCLGGGAVPCGEGGGLVVVRLWELLGGFGGIVSAGG